MGNCILNAKKKKQPFNKYSWTHQIEYKITLLLQYTNFHRL